MNNKSKYHQPVKTEKENIKLRRTSKNVATDKHLTDKKERVWERLSKIKKVTSSEKFLEENSHPPVVAKTHRRVYSIDHTLLKHPKQPSRKLVIPNNSSAKQRLNIFQKPLHKKPEIAGEIGSEILLHDLPLEEITSSCSFSSDSTIYLSDCTGDIFKVSKGYKESSYCSDGQREEFLEASTGPLLESCSEDRTQRYAGKFLRYNNKQMPFGDNDLAIDGVKLVSRSEISEYNPKPLKDILKTHVENILMGEFAVKKVLCNLESSENLQQKVKKDFPERMNTVIEYSDRKKEIQKFEVDVIFKNVPSLDREIEILRTLGEKLKATLKSTTIHRDRHAMDSQTAFNSTTKHCEESEKRNAHLMLNVRHDFKTEHFVLVSIHLSGIRQCVGIINEFSVTQKSIADLKREASRSFYIPTSCENMKLIKTSFENLKKNPNELFRNLKPKNSQIAFNVLEQDPIFFYSSLYRFSNSSYISLRHHNQNNEHRLSTEQVGDSYFGNVTNREAHKDTSWLIGKTESKVAVSCNFKSKKQSNLDSLVPTQTYFGSPTRSKQRRRIRRLITPMPIDYDHCPKNSVIKTILVGFVQVSIFIVFIVALTHPGLRCLNSSVS